MRQQVILAAAVLLAGCSERNPIQPGVYTAKAGPIAGTKVTIDAEKSSIVFAPPTGASITRKSMAWVPARWPMLCPRGMKDTRSEVIGLGDDPLVIGTLTVTRPVLVGDCLGKPIVDLMSLGADDRPQNPPIVELER